uniref:NADH-ubiquinone oxidoreductase chain 1 n=1 Tax=Spongiocaris panglao TaxID=1986577 RepID=A0A345F0N1_9EUCA|nr:NADH dehydrogenase subunit 1 [Spongiocaris panglao]AXG21506.1 NADH dehydrogenase subunit 1 [Spongiocaris panglao]
MVNNKMEILVMIVSYLILMICILVSVAFITLLERKVLGYIQIRKGPNKVGYFGILQPFSDAVKLFTKEQVVPSFSTFFPYYMSPIFSLFMALVVWVVMPYKLGLFSFSLSMLFFLCCMSLGVYSIMGAGWSSNSKYSLLGGLRAVAQTISYEVSLIFILMCFLFLVGDYSLMSLSKYQQSNWMLLFTFPMAFIWLVSCLAETNRTPFDFAESESELVSGFNTEYSSGGFALIFMAEYASILFMSMLFVLLFLGGNLMNISFYIKLVVISIFFIWARGTLPRFRYDKLMYLAWKSFLPISLNYLIFFMGVSFWVFL